MGGEHRGACLRADQEDVLALVAAAAEVPAVGDHGRGDREGMLQIRRGEASQAQA